MDRSHYRSRNTINFDCKGTQKIVDDPRSSNPHSLLPWLKRQLHQLIMQTTTQHSPQLLSHKDF